jgi:hypothetical protein
MLTFENHVTLSQFLENSRILMEAPSHTNEELLKNEEMKTDSVLEYEKCKKITKASSLIVNNEIPEQAFPKKTLLRRSFENDSSISCKKMCHIF